MAKKKHTTTMALLTAATLAAVAGMGRASVVTWTGSTGTSWNATANWGGDALPTDTALFTNVGLTANQTITLDASQTINTLSVNATPAFIIGSTAERASGYTLTLTDVNRTTATTGSQTIAANVVLGNNSTWTVNGSGGMAVTGTISGAYSLTKSGTANLSLSATNSYTGTTTILAGKITAYANSVIPGALTVGAPEGGPAASYGVSSGNPSGLVTGKDLTVYSNGTVNFGNGTQHIGTAGGTTSIIGGYLTGGQTQTDGGVLYMTGGTIAGNLYGYALSSVIKITTSASTSTAVVSANLNAKGTTVTTFTVADGAADIDLLVSGPISGATTGLNKSGPGLMSFANVGSFTGTTTIAGGILRINALANEGTLVTATAVNGSNTLLITGNMNELLTAGNSLAVGQVVTGYGLAPATTVAAFSGTTVTLSQTTTAAVATATFGVANASSIGQATTNASNLVLNGGVLQYTGTAVSTNRLFTVGTTAGSALDASGSGAVTFANTGTVVMSSNNVARTLTLTGSNTDDNTLAATLGDSGSGKTSITKSGVGKWVLAGANTYTGTTLVSDGALKAGNGTAFGASLVTVAGGVLDLRDFNVNNTIKITGSGARVLLQTSTGALTTNFAAGSSFRGWQRGSTGVIGVTTAGLLSGTAASAAALNSSWTNDAHGSGAVVSDVLDLAGTGAGNPFVLQLSYTDDAYDTTAMLGYWKDNTSWVNAIYGGGYTGGGLFVDGAYDGGLALGTWGRDAATNTVWAVVDHNSEFAVVVPEPAALALLGLGGLALLRRRHNP